MTEGPNYKLILGLLEGGGKRRYRAEQGGLGKRGQGEDCNLKHVLREVLMSDRHSSKDLKEGEHADIWGRASVEAGAESLPGKLEEPEELGWGREAGDQVRKDLEGLSRGAT